MAADLQMATLLFYQRLPKAGASFCPKGQMEKDTHMAVCVAASFGHLENCMDVMNPGRGYLKWPTGYHEWASL
jgi:hypothetical protein